MKETDIQRSILDYLKLKRVCHWRNNSGAMKTDRGGFYRFGTPGSPDIFVLQNGTIFGIEVKTETGRLSDTQIAFRDTFEANGGHYIIARSIDDLSPHGL